MKKLLVLLTLTLAMVACGEKKTEEKPVAVEEVVVEQVTPVLDKEGKPTNEVEVNVQREVIEAVPAENTSPDNATETENTSPVTTPETPEQTELN